jgi:hypothetical protein
MLKYAPTDCRFSGWRLLFVAQINAKNTSYTMRAAANHWPRHFLAARCRTSFRWWTASACYCCSKADPARFKPNAVSYWEPRRHPDLVLAAAVPKTAFDPVAAEGKGVPASNWRR